MHSIFILSVQSPTSEDEWNIVANEFETSWNVFNVIGALDGKHFTLRKPLKSGALFRNYKGTFSIVLMALVDSQYKFIHVDVGTNGRVSDGSVFSHSSLARAMESNMLHIPAARHLPGTDKLCHFHVLADEAFPLRCNIMKPYPFRNMSREQRIFNYRLSRGRRVVENAFGILSQRFRCLKTQMLLSPTEAETVVLAVCALHNFLITTAATTTYVQRGDMDSEDPGTHEVQPGVWRANVQSILPIVRQVGATTRHTEAA